MRRFLIPLLIALAALMLTGGPTAPVANATTASQLRAKLHKMTKSRNLWRHRATSYRQQRDDASDTLSELESQLEAALRERDAARAQASSTSQQLSDMTAQRDQALSGLPDAIKLVPISDFARLVFTPARAAWPCDSFYQSGSFWSYTFDSPSPYC